MRGSYPAALLQGVLGLAVLCLVTSPAFAGLHYSGEQFTELPSRFSGFLVDHRSLRTAAVERPDNLPPSPLRDDYLTAAERLEKFRKSRALTADESADLGALYVRLGRLDTAIGVLSPASRKNPDHFRLVANLGTAFQLSGDLDRAADALAEAVRLAPDKWREAEKWHLKLVQLRRKEGKAANTFTAVDDLFGVEFVGEPGKLADAEKKKLPADALAITQQLALWLPADGRLLWQLGELANAHGDVRTAAAILDGCVTEFALGAEAVRKHRLAYRAAADELAKNPEHEGHKITLKTKSQRPLVKAFDESTLPAIKADGVNVLPWPVLTATTTDAKGRPVFIKYLAELDGKTVTINGFMQPLRDELTVSGFLLLEYPVGCWFCETPEPTGMMSVELKAGKTSDVRKGLVKITGTLMLNRTDPETYLFRLTDARLGGAD